MADLKDFPVSFPYNATSSPYSPSKPHHGEDRAAPVGTAITVSGTLLGLVGSTGYSFGPHCHIDKNVSFPSSGGYVNPSNWVNIKSGTVVFAQDYGTAGKTVVVAADDGFYYRFLHMSEIKAQVGQRVGDEMITKDILIWVYGAFFGSYPTDADFKNWVGKNELSNLIYQCEHDARRANYYASVQKGFACINNPPQANFEEIPGPVYKKK